MCLVIFVWRALSALSSSCDCLTLAARSSHRLFIHPSPPTSTDPATRPPIRALSSDTKPSSGIITQEKASKVRLAVIVRATFERHSSDIRAYRLARKKRTLNRRDCRALCLRTRPPSLPQLAVKCNQLSATTCKYCNYSV